MKGGPNIVALLITLILLQCGTLPALAHSVNYHVEAKGMAVRAYYSEKDAAANSPYELYSPGDEKPHQTGHTDKNGYVAFVPDRPGTWRLKVWGESTHGFHGVTTRIEVDKALGLKEFSKPMVAAYPRYVTGISLVIGIFGIYGLWASRKTRRNFENAPPADGKTE